MPPSKNPGDGARLVRQLGAATAADGVSFIYERTTGDGVVDTLRVDARPGGALLTLIRKRPSTRPQLWKLQHSGVLAVLSAVADADVWSKRYEQEQRPARIALAFLFWASDGRATFEKRLFGSLPGELRDLPKELDALMARCESDGALAGSEPRKKGIGSGPPIGDATMKPDGTIVLDLRPELPGGGHGLSRQEYPKTHPDYADVLEHLGGLRPGENKLVPPWPD